MKLNKNGTPDLLFVKLDRCLFVETKAPGKELSPDQRNWFADAAIYEIPAIWADSLDSFIQKYGEKYSENGTKGKR